MPGSPRQRQRPDGPRSLHRMGRSNQHDHEPPRCVYAAPSWTPNRSPRGVWAVAPTVMCNSRSEVSGQCGPPWNPNSVIGGCTTKPSTAVTMKGRKCSNMVGPVSTDRRWRPGTDRTQLQVDQEHSRNRGTKAATPITVLSLLRLNASAWTMSTGRRKLRLPVEVDPAAQRAFEGDPVGQAGPDRDAVRCRDQPLLAGADVHESQAALKHVQHRPVS